MQLYVEEAGRAIINNDAKLSVARHFVFNNDNRDVSDMKIRTLMQVYYNDSRVTSHSYTYTAKSWFLF